jgi:dienelactone hydrolase
VVSGVQHLIAQGFVDERAIGAAGHSWGGYQTAFLVTRTNIFAAVESGAPVSNMISAYGGIRYETGVSRQFQYEQTQSRIGGTPWEFPLRYWENSPIHFADKVRTPVLILHNDQDGAVPWTQGIEYFMALRRLGRETYLFNYVGEPHGLRKRANQEDWSRRMGEYFAHHLRREPMPAWMQAGVPYSEREREKLAHTKSYLEVYVNPAPTPVPTTEAAAAGAADVGAKAVPAVSTGTEPAAVPASGREPEREKQQRERQQEE